MRQMLTLKEIQQYELNMLKAFVSFCETHSLRYFLAGGTLLGAIRHNGFIPWDDDIDILMPRIDYEQFLKLHDIFEKETVYRVASNRLNNLNQPFCKLFDTRVFAENNFTYDKNERHLWIDILPLDGLPADDKKVKKIYKILGIARMLLRIQKAKANTGKTPMKRFLKKFIKWPLKLIGMSRLVRFIDHYSQRYSVASSKFVGAVAMGLYGSREKMPKESYLQAVKVNFEGLEVNAPSSWSYYLTSIYGDYMTPPPISEQNGHFLKAWIEVE
ncbi:LicD family protein [Streptococcus marimammalium]|uniref:LicD family protein n=1 Tax=Streptococcus marimammalium TaxID=269666 RepID=UPI0003658222|nr:LicD family protein [Streptococcus marimammalium]